MALLGLALLGGCHLIYGYRAGDGGAAKDRLDVAPADTEPREASVGERGPAPPPCPGDLTLVACYRFEAGSVGMDGSGYGNDLTTAAVTSVPGVEGRAAKLTAASRLIAAPMAPSPPGPEIKSLPTSTPPTIRPRSP